MDYPGICMKTPYPVEDNLTEPTSSEVVVRVDFADRLSEIEEGAVVAAVDAWRRLIQAGAFGSEGHLSRVDVECYMVSPRLFELVVYNYAGLRESYSALINTFLRTHNLSSPIVAIELE
jgi:hypothetical protein